MDGSTAKINPSDDKHMVDMAEILFIDDEPVIVCVE